MHTTLSPFWKQTVEAVGYVVQISEAVNGTKALLSPYWIIDEEGMEWPQDHGWISVPASFSQYLNKKIVFTADVDTYEHAGGKMDLGLTNIRNVEKAGEEYDDLDDSDSLKGNED